MGYSVNSIFFYCGRGLKISLCLAISFAITSTCFLKNSRASLEYRYRLLPELVQSSAIVRFGEPVLLHKDDALKIRLVKIKVKEVLKGSLKPGSFVIVFCQDIMSLGFCDFSKTKTTYLFLNEIRSKTKYHSLAGTKQLYLTDPRDGEKLTLSDKESLRLFIKFRDDPIALEAALKNTESLYLIASLFSLLLAKNPNHPNAGNILLKILQGFSVDDAKAALDAVIENAYRLTENRLKFCSLVQQYFRMDHANIVTEGELELRYALSCPNNATWLLNETTKSANEYIRGLGVYYLAQTADLNSVNSAVQYFRENPSAVSLPLLEHLSLALFTVKNCTLMEEVVQEVMPKLEQVGKSLSRELTLANRYNPHVEAIRQNYVRCIGFQQGRGDILLKLLGVGETPNSVFRSKDPLSFRILAQAITALESQLTKRWISPNYPKLFEILVSLLDNGHPQLVPEIMHLLLKHFPQGESVSRVFNAATKAGAKNYHQSHAIMALLERGEVKRAIAISEKSPYKEIQKIGENLKAINSKSSGSSGKVRETK